MELNVKTESYLKFTLINYLNTYELLPKSLKIEVSAVYAF